MFQAAARAGCVVRDALTIMVSDGWERTEDLDSVFSIARVHLVAFACNLFLPLSKSVCSRLNVSKCMLCFCGRFYLAEC